MVERSDDDGTFLSRWSRRKVALRQGAAVPVAPALSPLPSPSLSHEQPVRAEPVLRPAQDDRSPDAATSPSASSAPTDMPAPTLDDVAQLTTQSDFSRFVAADVDASVKNAAMKKLFADPHFNIMDGLDIYIDDYNKFEPLTKANLKLLVSARALGLIDDELEEQPKPDGVRVDSAADNRTEAVNPPDENLDLRLQPDDAAGPPGVERSAAGLADPDDAAHDAVPPAST